MLGVINAALPMSLVAWGETHIDSSVAAIAQSSVPIFVVLLSLRVPPPRATRPVAHRRHSSLGFLGVAAASPASTRRRLVGSRSERSPSSSRRSRTRAAASTGSCRSRDTAGPVLAAGSMLAAAVVLLPFATRGSADARFRARRHVAGLTALILLPTVRRPAPPLPDAAALREPADVARHVPDARVRASSTARVLLDEPITAAMLGGLALILVGVALASGQRLFGMRVQEPARERHDPASARRTTSTSSSSS